MDRKELLNYNNKRNTDTKNVELTTIDEKNNVESFVSYPFKLGQELYFKDRGVTYISFYRIHRFKLLFFSVEQVTFQKSDKKVVLSYKINTDKRKKKGALNHPLIEDFAAHETYSLYYESEISNLNDIAETLKTCWGDQTEKKVFVNAFKKFIKSAMIGNISEEKQRFSDWYDHIKFF